MKTNPNDLIETDRFGDHPGQWTYGLTKREYFAAMAMQGMIGKKDGHVDGRDDDARCAKLSVKYADALIAELNKEKAE